MGVVFILLLIIFFLILANGVANAFISFAVILVGVAVLPIVLPIVDYIKKKGWLD
ncbi:MAG: hypothetical protein IJY95_00940 [Bacteroides sp.]|nr:hypothetical protein [Bacteroides sp.]